MGAVNIIGVLVFLAVDPEMPIEISSAILRGFQEFCIADGTTIIGGQTIQNPWPLIGGEATAICSIDNVVYSSGAKPGDYLVLTKPLGIQPIMAAYRIVRDDNKEFIDFVYDLVSKKELTKMEQLVIKSMTTSNKPVAQVFQEIPVNAATDITGFGLVGHSEEMVTQNKRINIEIEKIPIFKGALELSNLCGYGLETGNAAETAGGVLISIDSNLLDQLLDALKKKGINPRVIGKVIPGSGKVILSDHLEIVECEVV